MQSLTVSSKNADVVREAFARWATGDVERVVELYAPDVALQTGGIVVADGVHRGREEVANALGEIVAARRQARATKSLRLEEEGDCVLAIAEFVDGFQNVVLFRLRDGLIAEIEGLAGVEEGRRLLAQRADQLAQAPWADLGTMHFVSGVVEPAGEAAVLALGERRISTPLPRDLRDRVGAGDAVLAYLDDDGELLGWYLPQIQHGVDLRGQELEP